MGRMGPPMTSKALLQVLDIYAETLDNAAVSRNRPRYGGNARDSPACGGQGDPDSDGPVARLYELAEALLESGTAGNRAGVVGARAADATALADSAQQAAALAIWAKTLDRAGRRSMRKRSRPRDPRSSAVRGRDG